MKTKELYTPSLVISMQYFADPDSGTNDTDAGDSKGSPDSSDDTGKKESKPTFDDVLKDKAYQSEFDKRVNKALEKQKAALEAEQKEKAAEAEKLAKMNAEEKAQHEREKAEKALSDREKAVTRRELIAEAKSQFTEKGLPAELAEMLNYESADTCKSSMEAMETAFNKAVEKAVKERLKGKVPGMGAGNPAGNTANTLKGALSEKLYGKK